MAKGSIGADGVLKLVSRSEEGLEESEVKLSNFATWLKSIQHKLRCTIPLAARIHHIQGHGLAMGQTRNGFIAKSCGRCTPFLE